ncbi:enoyl-CoA hydratase/isomerase family protein [Formosa algae]|uniref:Methylglutaconyl-CoA hydratase n=1 Tax=Formosa algae TaxID=225843 RepID=A0A9X1C877_9FLAO|nr:enoyl-CoA hydratase/isomerase family protein [Formosa algae]MBP1838128.1 methylglutaconyl-CoA hydratase [Formosa algae]MDQ0334263.1 methylglutaconyl-CoA hydratase [Formosa algae]OEI80090.1 enoyl-CoA hydratase [Formosa algae]
MEKSFVKQVVFEGVSTITFYNPPHNALPSHLLKKLEEEIVIAGNNDAVQVVILESGGDRTFCAGASFIELINIETEAEGLQFFSGFAKVINAMRNCPKFIVCPVQGKTVGGGVGIAAAADYCLATQFASIKLSELSIGIGPFVIEPAVSRKIGGTAMAEMTINAEQFYDPQWAKQKGLYADVFESKATLHEAVNNLVKKLKTYHPEAMQAMKSVMWKDTAHWDDLLIERAKISGRLVLSPFTKRVLQKYKTT